MPNNSTVFSLIGNMYAMIFFAHIVWYDALVSI